MVFVVLENSRGERARHFLTRPYGHWCFHIHATSYWIKRHKTDPQRNDYLIKRVTGVIATITITTTSVAALRYLPQRAATTVFRHCTAPPWNVTPLSMKSVLST
ncbi:uncharacterized protein LOC135110408 isoform X2 [Scylla paramamosain]|uniref:uncharacterized protein LOC135110408 isoform X2 n=1 Tax=Scylla paramamosain TaxID=85552 RepID=UPI003083359E